MLSTRLARRFNNQIVVPPEVAGVSVSHAAREIAEIDRQLAAHVRRIDAIYAALDIADFEAQAKIVASVTPAYRQIVEAQEQAAAEEWAAHEVARLAFLTALRLRGVSREPKSQIGRPRCGSGRPGAG